MSYEQKDIICYDVDRTIFNGYTQKYLVDYLYSINKISLKFRVIVFFWFLLYKIGFTKNLNKPINYLLNNLKNLNKLEYNKIFDNLFERYIKDNIFKDAVESIKNNISDGNMVVLISTSLEPIISRISDYVGANKFFATKILFNGDICLGIVDGEVVDGDKKLKIFKDYLLNNFKNFNVNVSFYSDSFRDLDLLKFAQSPIVVNPDLKLKKFAKKNSWPIIYFN